MKDFRRAVERFKSTLELDPKFALACYYLGLAQVEMGDLEGAMGSFQRALELDPKISPPLTTWARPISRRTAWMTPCASSSARLKSIRTTRRATKLWVSSTSISSEMMMQFGCSSAPSTWRPVLARLTTTWVGRIRRWGATLKHNVSSTLPRQPNHQPAVVGAEG